MIEKLLKDAVTITVGKQAENIAPLINTKKHVNEFLIAKKLDITINQTRNILYKLSDHGLVSSIRKKDKKKGWYTYFWKIEKLKVLLFLQEILNKKKSQFENQIRNRETKQFYVCKTCKIEFNEENAMLYDFTCNECGNTFELNDNTKLLRELKRNLAKIEKEMELIKEEVEKEKKQIEKEKQKKLKKEEKEKAAKKAAKKKTIKKKITKKKTAKKTIKKKAKKKTAKKTIKKKITKKKTAKKTSKKK
ncbi:MAG: hypothetical protein OQK82_08530 [Candidatus Pacearchaeota archaeon]|nr:hypothetical protein [Candidatus Pacearchaeota archaeon]